MKGMKPAPRGSALQAGLSRLPSTTTVPSRTIHGLPPAVASTPAAALARSGSREYRCCTATRPTIVPLSVMAGVRSSAP